MKKVDVIDEVEDVVVTKEFQVKEEVKNEEAVKVKLEKVRSEEICEEIVETKGGSIKRKK